MVAGGLILLESSAAGGTTSRTTADEVQADIERLFSDVFQCGGTCFPPVVSSYDAFSIMQNFPRNSGIQTIVSECKQISVFRQTAEVS
jgi:hypothetical protein